MMTVTIALINLTAASVLLAVGGVLSVQRPRPRRAVATFVALDAGFLLTSLVALPLLLQLATG